MSWAQEQVIACVIKCSHLTSFSSFYLQFHLSFHASNIICSPRCLMGGFRPFLCFHCLVWQLLPTLQIGCWLGCMKLLSSSVLPTWSRSCFHTCSLVNISCRQAAAPWPWLGLFPTFLATLVFGNSARLCFLTCVLMPCLSTSEQTSLHRGCG